MIIVQACNFDEFGFDLERFLPLRNGSFPIPHGGVVFFPFMSPRLARALFFFRNLLIFWRSSLGFSVVFRNSASDTHGDFQTSCQGFPGTERPTL